MDLLMQNSPWNLILFMAIPVILAETIAITELFLLKSPNAYPMLSKVNHIAGVLAGLAFVGIIIYFIPNVIIPLATAGEFRTWIDVVAIFSYILAGIPMILLALLNLRLLFRKVIEQKESQATNPKRNRFQKYKPPRTTWIQCTKVTTITIEHSIS